MKLKWSRWLDFFFFFLLLYLALGQMLEWHEPMAQKWRDGYLLMIFAVVAFGGRAFR